MSQHPMQTRRRFLQTASAAGLVASVASLRAEPTPERAADTTQGVAPAKARNLIFMVSDGMSMAALSIAGTYARTFEGRETQWDRLLVRPNIHTGLQDTASASSLVTDSAAASSAWGGGKRVANGFINITPAGEVTTPILVKARRSGKRTGLVTTARVTHATPAGFLANIDNRGNEDMIAAQYLERGFDVCLGGGGKHFDPAKRVDKRDLAADFVAKQFEVVRDVAGLKGAPRAGSLLGLFWDDHLPYMIDRRVDPSIGSKVPTLAEMTSVALTRLSEGCENGFVLQVEGARIDHAAHNCDIAALVHEQLAFDEALGVVLEFQKQNPDTLVIVTADHATGNPGLMGEGKADPLFANLPKARESFDRIVPALNPSISIEVLQERLIAATGAPISLGDADQVLAGLRGKNGVPYRAMRGVDEILGLVLANHYSVGWAGHSHSGDYVLFNAIGPGHELFPSLVRNDAIHGIVCKTLRIA